MSNATIQSPLLRSLADTDPEIARAVSNERHRQGEGLELIASENFVSRAILEAAGSVLTNKYAEGYPGKRYYGGCEFVDVAESLAIARAKQIFGADHANVQPHSGAQANLSVYMAATKPGDVVMGMNLAHGGHLTHGHPLNFSGKHYKIVPYGVRQDDERIDYEELERLAHEHKPRMIILGGSAYPRVLESERVGKVAGDVGAVFMVDMAHVAGLVAGGVHPSPIPHADFVTSTTHKTLRGPRSGLILCKEQWAKDLDRAVFPGVQGGPLMHIVAAKAVCFKEALEPTFVDYQKQILANAQRLAVIAQEPRLPPRQRRHGQSPDARGHVLERRDGQGGRGGARPRGHHGEQERDPVRQEPADGGVSGIRVGTPAADHARHGRSRDGAHRGSHRAGPRRARRRPRREHGESRSPAPLRAVSAAFQRPDHLRNRPGACPSRSAIPSRASSRTRAPGRRRPRLRAA